MGTDTLQMMATGMIAVALTLLVPVGVMRNKRIYRVDAFGEPMKVRIKVGFWQQKLFQLSCILITAALAAIIMAFIEKYNQ